MSLVRQRRLTDKVTIWSKSGYDPDSPYSEAWGSPVISACNWIEGGSMQRDAEGTEFQPNKTIRLWGVTVNYGDKVYIGASTSATPPADAEIIRGKKGGGTMLIGKTDLTIYTG